MYNRNVQYIHITPEKRSAWGDFRSVELALLSDGIHAGLVVDEAHCVSTWGHDFRPKLRELGVQHAEIHSQLRYDDRFQISPISAYTATSPPRVTDDIIATLGLRDVVVVHGAVDRSNLMYVVVQSSNPKAANKDDLLKILVVDALAHVAECTSVEWGPGMIYLDYTSHCKWHCR